MNDRPTDQRGALLAEPFSWKASKDGIVFLEYRGRPVKILRGGEARKFLGRVEQLEDRSAQLLIAKLTGNFKRGNERG
jgi:hypothetical protein